jgi:hypothetical protein
MAGHHHNENTNAANGNGWSPLGGQDAFGMPNDPFAPPQQAMQQLHITSQPQQNESTTTNHALSRQYQQQLQSINGGVSATTAASAPGSSARRPIQIIATSLAESKLLDNAFYYALMALPESFLPDGHYHQDSITLEDGVRRQEMFNAAVDAYIVAARQQGLESRSPIEIAVSAKIGPDGGPLHYICGGCGSATPERARLLWCNSCRAVPYCGEQCARMAYAQHHGVCGSMLTKPVLLSQVILRLGVEVYLTEGLTGRALALAVVNKLQAVQRSYQAARTAASAIGIIDE